MVWPTLGSRTAKEQNLRNETCLVFTACSKSVHILICSPQSCSSRKLTLFRQLHWLPIQHRIDFKIANITFRTLHSSQPAYLRSSLHACHSTRSLRLSNLLSAPFVRTSFGAQSFSVAAPKIQNSLRPSLRTGTSRVVIYSVVTSRPTTASRPSNPLNLCLLARQIRLC